MFCSLFILLRNEASLCIEQLDWILPSSEWQIWCVFYCILRLICPAEGRSISINWATSLDSSFVRMTKLRSVLLHFAFTLSCWGTKHLYMSSNLIGFFLRQNDKVEVLYCTKRLTCSVEERSISVSWASYWDSSFVRMTKFRRLLLYSAFILSCWGTKHLYMLSNLIGFSLRQNDKVQTFIIVLCVYFVLLRNETSLFIV